MPVKKRLNWEITRAIKNILLLYNAWAIRCIQTACNPEYVKKTSKYVLAAGSCSKTTSISSFIRLKIFILRDSFYILFSLLGNKERLSVYNQYTETLF